MAISIQHLYLFFMLLSVHIIPAFQFKQGFRDDSVLCREEERQALLKVKNDLIDNYGHLSSWSTEEDKRDCCKWNGIVCSNRTGHVTQLDLSSAGKYVVYLSIHDYKPLRGKISHALFELRHLTDLYLDGNDFGGSEFPTENNGSLTKLRYLDLSNANFAGNISSLLRNLSSLESLKLSYNDFHDLGNGEWLSDLSLLTYLDLSRIRLVKPNDWFQIPNKLPHLKSLRLFSCFSADKIPLTLSPINSSSSLISIDLRSNNLIIPSIYPWLSNVSKNILGIALSSNILQGSPLDDVGNMISLEFLYLSNTTLEGGIPKSLGNMSRLLCLDLSRNNLRMQLPGLVQNLSGIINKSIGLLSELEILRLGSNSFNEVISEDHFFNLSNLKVLDLSENSFMLNISLDWTPPFHLDSINLRSCKIGPHFPKWLKSQENYSELDISNAGISDSVPMWFWDLSYATAYLNLSHNNLSGPVPHFSLQFSHFPSVDISSNRFHGTLPLPLHQSENMLGSSVTSNGKTTARPLIYLDLSDNLFSEVLPDHFVHMKDIVFLNLTNNNLSGEIPTSIGSLSELETLSLGNNALSGKLPMSLKNCTRLRFLDLSGNKLSGNIPSWIESLSSLQYLSLQSNKFHGSIPLQLCQLTFVQILDLSANNINGTIPQCLENLRAMAGGSSNKTIGHYFNFPELSYAALPYRKEYYIDKALILWKGRKYLCGQNLGRFRIIDLSSNKLEGEIPREISSLSMLDQLNLSNNKLTGPIPEQIAGLKQLESVDLSQNQLSGAIPSSMSEMNFLDTLNLSYNNLSGRIPSSTQLQSFNASAFSNNLALCGLPLIQKCPEDDMQQSPPPDVDGRFNDEDGDEFIKWFYVSMSLSFIVCFWGVSGTLLFNRACRHAFFQLLENFGDWLYVIITVHKRRLLQKFRS